MTNSDFEAWLDEFVNQTIENWVTMNSRPPSREDLIEHCLRLGAEAAWAKAQEEINKMVLEKLKFYVTPQLMAHEDAERYKQQADKLAEVLETLKVAVNDKVDDPGATAFIERALKEYRGEE